MNTPQFSLMTFALTKELVRKTMTVRDTFQMAADSGIPFVDLRWVSDKSIPEYRAAMADTGVSVCCYISGISFFAKEKAICRALAREMDIAANLGARLFMIVPYTMFLDPIKAKAMGRSRVLEKLVQGFRLAVEMGKAYGLQVCFETTPDKQIRLSGTEDCRYVLDRVPGLGLVFDTANMLPQGDDPLESYGALKEYILHVHLKDVELVNAKPTLFEPEVAADGRLMRGTVFGKGVIPVREIHRRMLADGYSGTFALEYIRPKSDCCSPAEHTQHLKKYLSHLAE